MTGLRGTYIDDLVESFEVEDVASGANDVARRVASARGPDRPVLPPREFDGVAHLLDRGRAEHGRGIGSERGRPVAERERLAGPCRDGIEQLFEIADREVVQRVRGGWRADDRHCCWRTDKGPL